MERRWEELEGVMARGSLKYLAGADAGKMGDRPGWRSLRRSRWRDR